MPRKNKLFLYPTKAPKHSENAAYFNIEERNFQYNPLLVNAFHWHDYFEMEFFCDGEATHILNGESFAVKRGSIYLLMPSDFHTLYSENEHEMKYYNVNFNEYALSSEFIKLIHEHDAPMQTVVTDEDYDTICREFKALCDEYNSDRPMKKLIIKSIFERIMIIFLRALKKNSSQSTRHKPNRDNSIEYIVSFLKIHFRESVTLSDIAKKVYLTPNYTGELFKKEMGVSFTEYVQHLRLNYAKNLLVSTDMSISNISAQSGFHSVSYFTKLFRLANNKTPLEHRNSVKKQNN